MKMNFRIPSLIAVSTLLVAVIVVLMPFHAFLTVWLSTGVGHYTALRLWKEVGLVFLVAVALYQLWRDKPQLKRFIHSRLNQLIVAYVLFTFAVGLISYLAHGVTLKAFGYGLIVDTRFLLFFSAVSVLARSKPKLFDNWPKLLFIPAAIVVGIGLLQYFALPYDVLRHFGYSDATIFPYTDINHNTHYIRIMSTLRGSNPLGAYLLLILSLLGALWLKYRRNWQLGLGLFSLVALVLTFSRSAWIGLVLAAGVLIWASLRTRRAKKLTGIVVVIVIVIAGLLALVLHNNSAFQNTFLHTSDHSTIKTSSNEGHASALKNGLQDVGHAPFGRGTGTAGPASFYNQGKTKIAENYFVQIAQETGLVGVALFIAIQLSVGRELWRKRQEPLVLGVLAALIGLTFVNLLSHAWADDTLAYVFWGLAAIALAVQPAKLAKSKGTKDEI